MKLLSCSDVVLVKIEDGSEDGDVVLVIWEFVILVSVGSKVEFWKLMYIIPFNKIQIES